MLRHGLTLIACCLCLASAAQDNPSLTGNWSAKYEYPVGRVVEAKVEISGNGGTWQILEMNRNDLCLGQKYPVVVSSQPPAGFNIAVNASQALEGCQNFSAQVQAAGPNTYKGQFQDGRQVVLTRQ